MSVDALHWHRCPPVALMLNGLARVQFDAVDNHRGMTLVTRLAIVVPNIDEHLTEITILDVGRVILRDGPPMIRAMQAASGIATTPGALVIAMPPANPRNLDLQLTATPNADAVAVVAAGYRIRSQAAAVVRNRGFNVPPDLDGDLDGDPW